MRRYSLTYFIGQSVKGLWRNGVMSVASITVLMSCLVLMGSFALLVFNINYNLEELGMLNEIAVFVEMDRTELEVADIEKQIRALANVADIDYISKAEAFEQEKAKYADYPELFSMISPDDGIYADTFIITYIDNSRVSTLQYQLEHINGVEKVNCFLDVASSIENLKNGIIVVFTWFLAVLFVVSIFVIMNTIKLAVYSRRQEISIMRYVGATNWFIVLPFIFEGMLIGLLSSAMAYVAERYLYIYIQQLVSADSQLITVIPYGELKFTVLAVFGAIGVLTGVLGSCISLNKYLKA